MKGVQSQNEATFRVLTGLYICALIDAQPPTVQDLEKVAREQMGLSQQRFMLSFSKLEILGFLQKVPDGTIVNPKFTFSVSSAPKQVRGKKVLKDVFMLTDLGHKWIDSWYHVEFSGNTVNFKTKYIKDPPIESFPDAETKIEDPVVVQQVLPAPAPDFWAKWGSVATLVALPLSVLLWWLS